MSDELNAEDALGGSYDVLRNRLEEQSRQLGQAAQALNSERQTLFGASNFEQKESVLLRTKNNCIPIDIVNLNGKLLFGYNVFLGMQQEHPIEDTFALHSIEFTAQGTNIEHVVENEQLNFLHGSTFAMDFSNLHRYNKDAQLIHLHTQPGRFLAVFQTSMDRSSHKVFRWQYDLGSSLQYMDDFGDEDYQSPHSHDFDWIATGPEKYHRGLHPHVNILDSIFVEMVGGDLTIKIEDNTEDGSGIYSEPVVDSNQSLDDGRIFYVQVGKLILLKMIPYREEPRYLVFNTINHEVTRLDAIGQSCLSLPEDQGIIVPGGFVLAQGGSKTFDNDIADLVFQGKIDAPNGEDVLYIYWRKRDGHYLLFSYNIVNKEVNYRIECHGYSFFDDGHLIYFKAKSDEPQKVHKMDVWRTPYMSNEMSLASSLEQTSYLGRLGNPELVRAVSDALSIQRLIGTERPTSALFHDISKSCTRMIDTYPWLAKDEAFKIKGILQEIRRASDAIVDEFLKVQQQQKQARIDLQEAQERSHILLKDIRPERYRSIEEFTSAMFKLDQHRAYLRSKEEVKFIDKETLAKIIEQSDTHLNMVCQRCADFLQQPDSLTPLTHQLEAIQKEIPNINSSKTAQPIASKLDDLLEGVMVLVNTLDRLEIDDHEKQLQIGQAITTVQSLATKVKQALNVKAEGIKLHESQAQFASKLQLFELSLETATTRINTPEEADEEITRLFGMLDDLESRFGEITVFAEQIDEKREMVQSAIFAIKQNLLEQRQQRVSRLFDNAVKIIEGLRSKTFTDSGELRNFFATDRRVERARKLADQIAELLDSVRSEEIRSNLKACEQDAMRKLRDASELFVGDNLLQFGKHQFAVNTTPFELTLAPYKDSVALHITGTDFHEIIEDPDFLDTKKFWNQLLPSENETVYRCEYLAASLLFETEQTVGSNALEERHLNNSLLTWIQEKMAIRSDEGYARGIHDEDTCKILETLITLKKSAGALEYPSILRSLSVLWWENFEDCTAKKRWQKQAQSYQKMKSVFGQNQNSQLGKILTQHVVDFMDLLGLNLGKKYSHFSAIGLYLIEMLANSPTQFVLHTQAFELAKDFKNTLSKKALWFDFEQAIKELQGDISAQFFLVMDWLNAFIHTEKRNDEAVVIETITHLLTPPSIWKVHTVNTTMTITGLQGNHPTVLDGKCTLSLDDFLFKMHHFMDIEVPAYRAYRQKRVEIIQKANQRLRLQEMRPRVLTSFVRNKLINDVYLHVIGDNLATQMGASGDKKRTDLMGMLLLISPPGYGKTTLMEYVASRLGLAFVKVNGPSLGHEVVSLDPAQAPNATARQEVEKINLAFEMANNVMLYLDDIQHTHPELLQKFISLCDGQRRVEGVWKGKTRTYDLRGKKFSVVMAGNPYTETGEKFRIPDMLANRADIYNLGDILSGKEHVFALSYIENALTSNSILAPLSTRDQKDIYKFAQMAEGMEIPLADLSHQYSKAQADEIVQTIQHFMRCRDVLLKVNAQYIFSAAQDDNLRNEPPFKLQGSYRNMNKLAEKLIPAMNIDEVEALITDHYRGESQTLTTGARSNLLKLDEMRNRLKDEELADWIRIKEEFLSQRRTGGSDDPAAKIVGGLHNLQDQIKKLHSGQQLDNLHQTLSLIPKQLQQLQQALPQILQGIPFPVQEWNFEKIQSMFQEIATSTTVQGVDKITAFLEKEQDIQKNHQIQEIIQQLENLSQALHTLGMLQNTPSAISSQKVDSANDHPTPLPTLSNDVHFIEMDEMIMMLHDLTFRIGRTVAKAKDVPQQSAVIDQIAKDIAVTIRQIRELK